MAIFLISGFLMVPSGVFALEETPQGSASLNSAAAFEDVLQPQVKARSSPKIKISDGDDDVSGEGDVGSWWIYLIIGLIIVLAIIAVWYFFLRK